MALNLMTNPVTPPVSNPDDWNNFVDREDKTNRGSGVAIDTIGLTNWDSSTTVPAIAKGSVIEVGGSLYLADSDTALTEDSGLANGLVHIKLVPSGGTVVPTVTSDSIPAWDTTKGGWYDSDEKFLPFEMTRSASVYSEKKRFPYQNMTYSFSSVGDMDIDGAIVAGGSATFGGGGSFGGGVSISGAINGVTNINASGDISCDDISCSDINLSGSVGPLKPSTAVKGSFSLGSNETMLIPAGMYLFDNDTFEAGYSTRFAIEANFSAGWEYILMNTDSNDDYNICGGLVFSDGVNVRLATYGSNKTINYIKF